MTQNTSTTPVYFGYGDEIIDGEQLFSLDYEDTLRSQDKDIQSACAAEDISDKRYIILLKESIYYVPNSLEQKISLPLPITQLKPTKRNVDKFTSVNLHKTTMALLLKDSPDSDDLTLFCRSQGANNPHEFLDATLTWKSKHGEKIKDGIIIAIKDSKEIIWKNNNRINAINAKLKELDAPLEGDTQAIHSHQQKIIFGPPGTGKSYSVRNSAAALGLLKNDGNIDAIRTTFHPEYSYGDFVAKLLPLTVKEISIGDDSKPIEKTRVEYQIHAGPFIQALAQALADKKNVLLVIEEINRGNCAAIFGDIFQLLDRNDKDVSEHPIDPSKLTRLALIEELLRLTASNKEEPTKDERKNAEELAGSKLALPNNLSIVATMNTSDESVFYMDSAFKRRWQFQYIGPDDHKKTCATHTDANGIQCPSCAEVRQQNAIIRYKVSETETETTWEILRKAINAFLLHKDNSNSVRRIEDKQLGLWFIKAKEGNIVHEDIKFKLMHFLWDNVFARDKKPLRTLLKVLEEKDLITFGQFAAKSDQFIQDVIGKYPVTP